MILRAKCAEIERKLAAERKRAHGEIANQILGLGNVIQSEKLAYVAFQRQYGKSVKVRAPGMFVEQLRRKAESAGGVWIELPTWALKMSQYDHTTGTYTKKPLSQRWHVPVMDRALCNGMCIRHSLRDARSAIRTTHPISMRCGRLRNLCCCKRGGCVYNLQRSNLLVRSR